VEISKTMQGTYLTMNMCGKHELMSQLKVRTVAKDTDANQEVKMIGRNIGNDIGMNYLKDTTMGCLASNCDEWKMSTR
jgi:hypothetical protein